MFPQKHGCRLPDISMLSCKDGSCKDALYAPTAHCAPVLRRAGGGCIAYGSNAMIISFFLQHVWRLQSLACYLQHKLNVAWAVKVS